MSKNFFLTEVVGDNTKIICEDSIYFVPTNIIKQIVEFADNEEEAVDLYAYIKTRMESYNASLKISDRRDVPRGDFSPIMIKDILVSLLSEYTYEKVLDMLESVNDYDLFSAVSLIDGLSSKEAIGFLVSYIKENREGFLLENDEEDEYNNRNDRCNEIYLRRLEEEKQAEAQKLRELIKNQKNKNCYKDV